jgi:heme exporter protein A
VLEASLLKKAFNRRVIFEGISFSVNEGQTLLITGRNGSGKSTLLKILARVLTPTEGSIRLVAGTEAVTGSWHQWIGFVSPHISIYEEFTGKENLDLALSVRGFRPDRVKIDSLLDRFALLAFRDTPARFYSSGMKQRLKYAFALVHRPSILLLDEPMSSLDRDGTAAVAQVMEEHRRHGVLVVATNDPSEVGRAEVQVHLKGRE